MYPPFQMLVDSSRPGLVRLLITVDEIVKANYVAFPDPLLAGKLRGVEAVNISIRPIIRSEVHDRLK